MADKNEEGPHKRKISLPGLAHLSSLIGTNYGATDDQISEINTLLVLPLKRLKSIEGEMAKIRNILEHLSQQHDALSAEINSARAFISPMRRIPTDILQEIFHHCLPKKHNAVMNAKHCPLLLTRVCRSWRNVALATPDLWVSLHIPVPSLARHGYWGQYTITDDEGQVAEAVARRVMGVQEWLARSSGCPLSLSLLEEDTGSSSPPSSINPVILGVSGRWKILVLDVPPERLSRLASVTEIPILESLTIIERTRTRPRNNSETNNMWETSTLLKAPNLREVFLKLSTIPLSLPLKWVQLTSFTFKALNYETSGVEYPILHVARMLQPCVNLVNLDLQFSAHVMSHWSDEAEEAEDLSTTFILTFPMLSRLIMHDRDATHEKQHMAFFDALHTPSLRYLDICANLQFSFLSRTPSLRELHLNPKQFTQGGLIQLLRHCPQLISLAMLRGPTNNWGIRQQPQVHIFDDNMLDLFISSHSDGSYLCPELQDLECRACVGFSDEAMANFIARKQDGSLPGVAKLKRFHVEFDRPRKSWTNEHSKRFVEDGLGLIISHINHSHTVFRASEGIQNSDYEC